MKQYLIIIIVLMNQLFYTQKKTTITVLCDDAPENMYNLIIDDEVYPIRKYQSPGQILIENFSISNNKVKLKLENTSGYRLSLIKTVKISKGQQVTVDLRDALEIIRKSLISNKKFYIYKMGLVREDVFGFFLLDFNQDATVVSENNELKVKGKLKGCYDEWERNGDDATPLTASLVYCKNEYQGEFVLTDNGEEDKVDIAIELYRNDSEAQKFCNLRGSITWVANEKYSMFLSGELEYQHIYKPPEIIKIRGEFMFFDKECSCPSHY